jgi:hypothetical protein
MLLTSASHQTYTVLCAAVASDAALRLPSPQAKTLTDGGKKELAKLLDVPGPASSRH